MRKYFENKWIILGIIWVSCILITIWNGENTDKSIKLKRTYDELHKNRKFVEANLDQIEKVIEKKELFSQTIESVQFGFISLENDLQKISDNFSLSKLKIDYNKKTFLNKNAASVQIKLNFYGSLIDTLSYMNTLEKDNPFIRINNVKAAFDKNLLLPNFELNLTYKYQVSAAQI